VPVEFKVATIFCAMIALLPMPLITSLPLQEWMASIALTKSPLTKCCSWLTASASEVMVRIAISFMVAAVMQAAKLGFSFRGFQHFFNKPGTDDALIFVNFASFKNAEAFRLFLRHKLFPIKALQWKFPGHKDIV
jgi:hypothetical protein